MEQENIQLREGIVDTSVSTKGEEINTDPSVKEMGSKVEVSEAKFDSKPDVSKKASLSDKLFSDEKVDIPKDYTIDFPKGVSEADKKQALESFVKNGLSKADAQVLTDSLAKSFQEHIKSQEEKHNRIFDEDILKLKREYGLEGFSQLNKKVKGFVKEVGLSGETFDNFIAVAGAYNAFKLLEKLSRSTRDSSYSPPPPSQRGSQEADRDFDKVFDTPDFGSRVLSGDMEATKTLRQWAEKQATLNQ
ncbi:hypothetical protein WSI_05460 [Candidatus Liberibacter asiaticus str. gxpsy]|uniref:Uncharacterized protein n=1 Tax=Candidatus Liberibacter asiaticus str. gxpsy TaxID=1174529 RepID=A0ABM5NH33_LIBAS|nr:hypothetical protein [Candidatus Liberibacter asiaticus]AGH17449.1 hypothetical protein WSI_05460 [Candidatus Liberibacter asiaticus str. gxpsy]